MKSGQAWKAAYPGNLHAVIELCRHLLRHCLASALVSACDRVSDLGLGLADHGYGCDSESRLFAVCPYHRALDHPGPVLGDPAQVCAYGSGSASGASVWSATATGYEGAPQTAGVPCLWPSAYPD